MARTPGVIVAALSAVSAAGVPTVPKEYVAVIQMKVPYIGLETPLRVLTSAKLQKIEYYDGLEVDLAGPNGTYKYAFNNSARACLYSPPDSGPTSRHLGAVSAGDWAPLPFLPDLNAYNYSGEELIGGILCQKYTLDARHGSLGTMDDHIALFWDPVLDKPVRWHMHARHVTFGSHTDEYIMDFLSFRPGAPAEADLRLPAGCDRPRAAKVSIRIGHFLEAAHAMRAPPATGDVDLRFDAFAKQYGKSYAAEPRIFRRAVFERNVRLVRELNEKHAGRVSFRGNQFLDMTREEVLSLRGGRAKTAQSDRRLPEHWRFVRTHKLSTAVTLPMDFDWRTARPGVVGPVKDQAFCGSCWAYGLTEPIESIQAVRTGRFVVLPEQFVVDCTWLTRANSSSNAGCDGGNSDVGALEIVRKYGGVVPTAKAYGSYLSVNGFCKDTRLMEVGAKITGWVDIPARNEQALMQALVSQGPISVSIMVPDEMLFYDSGVLEVASCKQDPGQIDHSVVLTGFGTDEHGKHYYTIRNSWSSYWGDLGYIKIMRGELDCCVSCEAGYPELDSAASTGIVV